MNPAELFDQGPVTQPTPVELPSRIGPKRLQRAVRNQIEFRECALNELLPDEHRARIVWAYVCSLDLAELYARIQAVEAGPGQNKVFDSQPLTSQAFFMPSGRLMSIFSFDRGPTSFWASTSSSVKRARRISPSAARLRSYEM